MRLHTSLLIAFCCTLTLSFASAEPTHTPNAPIVAQFDGDRDDVDWSADAIPESVVPAPAAEIDTVSISTLRVPGVHPIKTTARLTLLPDEHWQTVLADDSFMLMVESGVFRVDLLDGRARIARATDAILAGLMRDEIASEEPTMLWAGDRLVAHDGGVLRVHSIDATPATATIIRVNVPTAS